MSVIFTIKIHAKYCQITHKTIALPMLKITNEVPLNLSALPQENCVMKNKGFHRAIQPNHMIYVADFCCGWHVKICCSMGSQLLKWGCWEKGFDFFLGGGLQFLHKKKKKQTKI